MNATKLVIGAGMLIALAAAAPVVSADPGKGYAQCVGEFVISQVATPSGCQTTGDIAPTGTEFQECQAQVNLNPSVLDLAHQCVANV